MNDNGAPEEAPLEFTAPSVHKAPPTGPMRAEPVLVPDVPEEAFPLAEIDAALDAEELDETQVVDSETADDRPEETPYERRLWASMCIAGDLLTVEALALSEPVPVAALKQEWADRLGLQDGDFVVVDDAMARRIELLRRAEIGKPALEHASTTDVQPFTGLDLDSFLATPPAPPDWDLQGWYARGDLVIAFGDPGVGKSLWALAIAVRAGTAAGGEHLGDLVAARRELFVDLESPLDVVYQRLHGFGVHAAVAGLTYLHRPLGFDLLDAEGLARLRETIIAAESQAVVIDSLRRAAPGLDENDSRQVSVVLSALRTLAAELHVTILLIHHPRKPVGEARVEALYAARGSGDLIGSADSAIFFRKLAGGLVRVEHAKARRGREHDHVHFRIVTNDETGGPVLEHVEPDQALANDELDADVLAYIVEHPGASTKDVENGVTGSRATVRNSLARLSAPGEAQSIAVGAGRHPSGKYWYPATQANLLSPGDTTATLGDTLAGPSQAEVVAVSPATRRGGDTSGDTFGDREDDDPEATP